MVLSIFILLFCVGALTQLSVAFSRTLLIAYGKVEISERTRDMAGINPDRVEPEEFCRLMDFVRAAPDPGDDSTEIGIVRMYFWAMNLLRILLAPVSHRISQWADRELSICVHFAAVTLDRRMTPPTSI